MRLVVLLRTQSGCARRIRTSIGSGPTIHASPCAVEDGPYAERALSASQLGGNGRREAPVVCDRSAVGIAHASFAPLTKRCILGTRLDVRSCPSALNGSRAAIPSPVLKALTERLLCRTVRRRHSESLARRSCSTDATRLLPSSGREAEAEPGDAGECAARSL
jgi:hypothetical protein